MNKSTKKPELHQSYSRDEIHEIFGGSKMSALPFKDGVPVCGCYIPEMNPNAPKEILVGAGELKEQYSRIAAEQNIILPIFLKRAVKKFEFIGYYRAIRYSTNFKEIEEKNNTDRDDVAAVLYFEEAKTV